MATAQHIKKFNSRTCPKCTLKNEAKSAKCLACETPAPAPSSNSKADSSKKVKCPACTFENRPRYIICEMCGTVLNNNNNVEEEDGDKNSGGVEYRQEAYL